MARDWSDTEIEAIIEDYFSMLKAELDGRHYSKTDHRRSLAPLLDDRSEGSIEFKHQNISAVLALYDYRFIQGYKPRINFQTRLEQLTLQQIADDRHIKSLLTDERDQQTATYARFVMDRLHEIPVDPPLSDRNAVATRSATPGHVINWIEREDRNRRLGERGERFILEYEKARLTDVGCPELSGDVIWASKDIGDGLGYDIGSFTASGDPLNIEVKTTNLEMRTPFFISRNELEFASQSQRSYRLYRVFDFCTLPRFFVLRSPLDDCCRIEPSSYMARV